MSVVIKIENVSKQYRPGLAWKGESISKKSEELIDERGDENF
jgi:hypothetical protein